MVARTRSGSSNHRNTTSTTASKSGKSASSSSSVASTKSVDRTGKYGQEQPNTDGQNKRVSGYPKIDETIMKMKASLSRFTRANDRRMVLRTLKEVKYLKALPVDNRPPPMVDLEELEMEIAKENLILNGQSFHRKTKYGRTSTDFLHVLHELCYQLCDSASDTDKKKDVSVHTSGQSVVPSLANALSPDTLYYDLLCRLARTITSADSFGKLNDVLGSTELILMNSSAERKPKIKKTKALPTEMGALPPIEVNIFEEGGNIHAHIVTTLGFGLYRKLDVNTGRPWIKMQAELNERINFSSGSQVRHVTCIWPDMYV